jgi:hypothetical protein
MFPLAPTQAAHRIYAREWRRKRKYLAGCCASRTARELLFFLRGFLAQKVLDERLENSLRKQIV